MISKDVAASNAGWIGRSWSCPFARRIAGWVPSRAADNLFWLGRYLERAEATLRLVRALGTSQRDPGKGSSPAQHALERIQRLLVTWGATSLASRTQPAKIAAEALQAEDKFGSALSLVRAAQRTATSLRERLSPDAWQVITEMVERLAQEVECKPPWPCLPSPRVVPRSDPRCPSR